jgi:hypothetical protein
MIQKAAATAKRYVGLAHYWVSYAGAVALSLILAAAVAMPLGQVVIDYWSPKVAALVVAPQPAAKAAPLKGKL